MLHPFIIGLVGGIVARIAEPFVRRAYRRVRRRLNPRFGTVTICLPASDSERDRAIAKERNRQFDREARAWFPSSSTRASARPIPPSDGDRA